MAGWSTDTVTAVNYHSDAESIVRLNNKSLGENERNQTYKRWWKEQVRLYGTSVNYYVRKFDLSKTDKKKPKTIYPLDERLNEEGLKDLFNNTTGSLALWFGGDAPVVSPDKRCTNP